MSFRSLKYSSNSIDCQVALFDLSSKINNKDVDIEDIGDYIPGSVMVQDLDEMTNLYMNSNGCEVLRHSKEELNSLGPAYFDLFFPPEEIISLKPEITKFLQLDDPTRTYSFFQRVRPNKNTEYKWYLSNVRLYKPSVLDNGLKLMNVAIEVDNICCAAKKINSICEQNEFVQKNYFKFMLLTKREKEIIKLIASGYNSRYISDLLFISLHTVNNHRKNILNKLNIKSLIDLIKFAAAYSIV
jgi:LuxR family transcriptional regulator